MRHFAELDQNNKVIRVLVLGDELNVDENDNEVEIIGISNLKSMFGMHTIWKQTSHDENFRKNFASVGGTYDEEYDFFIEEKPYDSWILNTDTAQWESPIEKPDLPEDGSDNYYWDEDMYQSDNTKGWVFEEIVIVIETEESEVGVGTT
jgi:hypothetical protein